MADNGPDTAHLPGPTGESAVSPRRSHTYSRFTTAVAVLALATAAYALWRLDVTRDRLEEVATAARAHDAERELLRAELRSLDEREQRAGREIEARLAALADVHKQVQELANATEELRGRAQGPERAW